MKRDMVIEWGEEDIPDGLWRPARAHSASGPWILRRTRLEGPVTVQERLTDVEYRSVARAIERAEKENARG